MRLTHFRVAYETGTPLSEADIAFHEAIAPASSNAVLAKCRAVVLDLEGVDFIDSQGAAKLSEIHQLMDADGVTLRLARVKPNVLKLIQADGIVDLIGADHINGNVNRAIEAQLADGETNGPPPGHDTAGAAS